MFFGPIPYTSPSPALNTSGTCDNTPGHAAGPAEYYQPLVRRVLELVERGERVIVTGHSLGGGLAGVVGALAGV